MNGASPPTLPPKPGLYGPLAGLVLSRDDRPRGEAQAVMLSELWALIGLLPGTEGRLRWSLQIRQCRLSDRFK